MRASALTADVAGRGLEAAEVPVAQRAPVRRRRGGVRAVGGARERLHAREVADLGEAPEAFYPFYILE